MYAIVSARLKSKRTVNFRRLFNVPSLSNNDIFVSIFQLFIHLEQIPESMNNNLTFILYVLSMLFLILIYYRILTVIRAAPLHPSSAEIGGALIGKGARNGHSCISAPIYIFIFNEVFLIKKSKLFG